MIKMFDMYNMIQRYGKKDYFLTVEELISATHEFMRKIKSYLDDDNDNSTVIFFLDKSARPVAYMFRKLFPL